MAVESDWPAGHNFAVMHTHRHDPAREIKPEAPLFVGDNSPFGMLDLLATVATQTLENDPSLSTVSVKEEVKPAARGRTARRLVDHDGFDMAHLKRLSGMSLVKLFSTANLDEMSKKFRYTCVLLPGICSHEVESFGSEAAAKHLMKSHIQGHVEDLGRDPAWADFTAVSTFAQKRQESRNNLTSQIKTEIVEQQYQNSEFNSAEVNPDLRMQQSREQLLYLKREHVDDVVEEVQQEIVIHGQPQMQPFHHQFQEVPPLYSVKVEPISNSSKTSVTSLDHPYSMSRNPKLENMETNSAIGEDFPESEEDEVEEDAATEADQWVQAVIDSKTKDDRARGRHERVRLLLTIGAEVEFGQDSCDLEMDALSSQSLPVLEKSNVAFIGPVPSEADEKRLATEAINELQAMGSSFDEYWCKVCTPQRRFAAYSTLLSHLRSHAGFRPYECHICNTFFTRQHSLNYHMLIHANETRFTCEDCGRKFRHPSHYKEHRKRHTGNSPFACGECATRYKTRNTYKRHLKLVHGRGLTPGGSIHPLPPAQVAAAKAEEAKKDRERLEKKTKTKGKAKVKADPAKVKSESKMEAVVEDSDSIQGHDDEVAEISRKLQEQEDILNGKRIQIVSAGSSGSYSPSTNSEFSSPEPEIKMSAKVKDEVFAKMPVFLKPTGGMTGEEKLFGKAIPSPPEFDLGGMKSELLKFDSSPPAGLAALAVKFVAAKSNQAKTGAKQVAKPLTNSSNILKPSDRSAFRVIKPKGKYNFEPTKVSKGTRGRKPGVKYPKPQLTAADNIVIKKPFVLPVAKKKVPVVASNQVKKVKVTVGPTTSTTMQQHQQKLNPPKKQQAFLAQINGKQVLIIPTNKLAAQKKPAEANSQSKLEQCLRFGSAAAKVTASTTAPKVTSTTGQRLVITKPRSATGKSGAKISSIRIVPMVAGSTPTSASTSSTTSHSAMASNISMTVPALTVGSNVEI